MSSSGASSKSSPSAKAERKIDPIVRNALRYSVSPREYELLHQYLLSRAPIVRKRAPLPRRYDSVSKGTDDYNAAAIRASLRLAVLTFSGLKAWELIVNKLKQGPAQGYVE